MSYLARSLRSSRTTFIRPYRLLNSAFHTSRVRFAMSESDRAIDMPDRDAKIDEHKHDSINKAKTGGAEWKPELASNSEQGVKADKHDMSMEELQKHGAQKAEERKEPSSSK